MPDLNSLLMVLAVLGVLAISCQKHSDDQTAGAGEPAIDSVSSSDSLKVYYEVYGQGDSALVLVHGWGSDRSFWKSQVEAFKDEFNVVTVDLGGYGQSGTDRGSWTIESFGEDVASVVNDLNLKDVILVGHSMGGAIIIEAARRLPGRVTALVGVDTYQDLTEKWEKDQADQFLAPFRSNYTAAARQFVRSMFSDKADSALTEAIVNKIAASDPAVGISALENLFSYDAVSALKDVPVPIRAINTDTYPTNVESNREAASSFEVTIMPGYGHFLHLEDPATFNSHLAGIIQEFWHAGDEL